MKLRYLLLLLLVFTFLLLYPVSLSADSYDFSTDGFTQPEEVETIEEIVEVPLPEVQPDVLPDVPSFEFQQVEQLEPYVENYSQTYASGNGLYVLIRDFIGYVPDYANQNFNQYQYLYPASVIVTIILIVLVAKVLFTLVDRLF